MFLQASAGVCSELCKTTHIAFHYMIKMVEKTLTDPSTVPVLRSMLEEVGSLGVKGPQMMTRTAPIYLIFTTRPVFPLR